ncbi:pyruvate,water dikinase [Kibdelosporangium banguiense]|uniref:Pyruvate,water dikinase n=1 Tax=Kibdelosporangium banguiense TaxID=1365924 RepID=A0ABS4T6E4_9PSEU|nr:pyruvate,water dikinase [Kibdelosporangium banguiense]
MSNGPAAEITAALAGLDYTDPAAVDVAATRIARCFNRFPIPTAVADAVRSEYSALDSPVAVRSSATAEDLPDASFAGQYDTFLNVQGVGAVLAAVKRCWASLWTSRAMSYRALNGISPDDVALAVIVQRLVPATAAGVMFTADPLTGTRNTIVINAAWGLGESVVSGQVTPDTYVFVNGKLRSQVNDKTVMTIRTADGVAQAPVAESLRTVPVLSDTQAVTLAELGRRIEDLHGAPMDVEWAIHDGQFAILQARPIANLPAEREAWNDSLGGDYLWTCANLREAVPSVMTPVTWSLAQALAMPDIAGHPTSGNIGGRFYLNISTAMAALTALGLGRFALRAGRQIFGRMPDGMTIPPLPVSRFAVLRSVLAMGNQVLRESRQYRRNLDDLLIANPARCADLRRRIESTATAAELARLWRSDVDDLLTGSCRIFNAGARQGGAAKFASDLAGLVGQADANSLLTGLHSDSGVLESLGPMLGLARLRRGEITTEAYAAAWGHRSHDEFEISTPRPGEDPSWISRLDVDDPAELLDRQAKERAAAWERLRTRHPRKAASLERRLAKAAVAARTREQARSEFARCFWVFRTFVQRAAELTGQDMFFLPVSGILAVLDGDSAPLAAIPARHAAYEHYSALPAYPTLIRGAFEPESWAASTSRRSDVFDATTSYAPLGDAITGFPGVPGVVEGIARVVSTVEEAADLQPGEILVTTVTNIGWTPLFPRAAAVVTDIGAPLSHAAIVARELGIPAVVGCGNATARLKTGQRIQVDGSRGTVTIFPREPVD